MLLPSQFETGRLQVHPTLFLVGKRTGQSPIVAMAAGHNTGLFFLSDKISGRQFLVDTRAEISVISATASDKRTTQGGPLLSAANGTAIKTYGSRNVPLQFTSKVINGFSPLQMSLAPYWEQIFYDQTPF